MERREKFKLLDEIGLTKAEADEYFAQRKIIKTLYPIVYCSTKKDDVFRWQYDIEILPYLDLSRIHEVWGIDFNGVLLYKSDSQSYFIVDQAHGRIPDEKTVKEIFRAETKINLCLYDLMMNDVEDVELIDSTFPYQTDEQNDDLFWVCYARPRGGTLEKLSLKRAYIRPIL